MAVNLGSEGYLLWHLKWLLVQFKRFYQYTAPVLNSLSSLSLSLSLSLSEKEIEYIFYDCRVSLMHENIHEMQYMYKDICKQNVIPKSTT